MECPTATLDELTTDPNLSEVLDHDLISTKEFLYIDEFEYTLGLERGGLIDYRGDASLMSAKLRSDMRAYNEEQVWALLPSTEMLNNLFDLFTHNREAATPEGRVLFTDYLPVAEYTYRLLPPVLEDSEQKPVYIRGARHDPPYTNLPLIQANIHPAIAFGTVMDYVMTTYSMALHGCPLIDDPLYKFILQIKCVLTQPVPIQWLHGTWKEYQDRGIVPVRKPRKEPRPKEVDVRSKTPEERDYKPDHPLVLNQQQKKQKYMRDNNERSTALAKGSDIRKHSTPVVTTLNVQPARSSSRMPTEPGEEPPAKRSKTQTKKGGRQKMSTGSPLRRSTRKPKNPPKYT